MLSIFQLVKDIRRLVDNGEFLSSKHAKSPVVKLMMTLLLELITDHSREVRNNIAKKRKKKKDVLGQSGN